MIKNISKLILLAFVFLSLFSKPVLAQEEYQIETKNFKGKIKESIIEDCNEDLGYICVKYKVEILDGEYKGKEVESIVSAVNSKDDIFREGSTVYLSLTSSEDFDDQWNVESYSREGMLLMVFAVFVLLIFFVTGFKGFKSIVGLILSFVVIYLFTIPNINNGASILLISITSIFLLLIATTFVTYGFNKKSLIAFISSVFGVLIIFLVGLFVVNWLDIAGNGEESAAMLYDTLSKSFSLPSVYLLGIVIAALGVLDDVTVGQTSTMMEIYDANKSLSSKELYSRTMNVGKDHIASMINTLFIAYAGSSFTLIMLLSANNPTFGILINTEFIVEEIIRTLVASIGLILVAPLTTYIASVLVVKQR